MLKRIFVMVLLTLLLIQPMNVSAKSEQGYNDMCKYMIIYADKYNLPLSLVVQVVKVESNFNPDAVNKHGKYADEGLMQLNNQFSYKLAGLVGIPDFNPYSEKDNIWAGCYHLSNIRDTQYELGYRGKELWRRTLSCYNTGGSYLKKYGIREDYIGLYDLEDIN